MMRVLAGSVVLAIMLTAVNVLAAQVYLKDGAVVDCQSFWQKSGTVYVKPTYYDSNGVRTSAGSAFTLDLTNNKVFSITWDATYSDSTAFKFTMTNDVTITPSASCKPSAITSCTPYTGKVFYLSLASLTKSATATDYVYGVKSTMYAAYWNSIEITEDRSGGAHNPGVIMDAINGAIAASSTYNN